MKEEQIELILVSIYLALLLMILIGVCVYAISICCIRRLHKVTYLLTLNVCLADTVCAIFWVCFFIMDQFFPNILWTQKTCLLVLYSQTTSNCLVTYSICVVSLNRLFTIIYGQRSFFHTTRGIALCIGCEWLMAIIMPLLTFFSDIQVWLYLIFHLKLKNL